MEQLLDMAPDIVLVTTENALHGTVISKTLRRGIHVVVDKPLAICQTHAAEIWKASEEGKECVLQTGFLIRNRGTSAISAFFRM